jgi:hypothetical protein
MQTSPSAPATDDVDSPRGSRFWQELLYRWFVQYNPLYLLSAALVLAGCFLWSRGLVREESLAGPLGIAFVAELYATSLIGGAALLTRIGFRRPAVMLALLVILYQWDTTLHTETCAYLGAAGAWATALWLLVFVGKLYAIGWALRVRLDRHLVAAALVAAVGLALGPRIIPGLGGRGAGAALAVWLFALASLYRRGGITATAALNDWGHTVLRRVTGVAWVMSGALVGSHVLMWWRDHDLPLSTTLLAVPLLAVRRVRSEGRMWAIVAGTLVFAALALPGAFFALSFIAAAALSLRALAPAFPDTLTEARPYQDKPSGPEPYRAGMREAWAPEQARVTRVAGTLGPAERVRSLVGALFAAYLSVWTLRWTSGPWPAHAVWLDVGLTVLVAIAVWRMRARVALVPLAACYAHLIVQAHLVPIPTTSVAWGETTIALGFALLAASLLASYRLRAYGAGLPTDDGRWAFVHAGPSREQVTDPPPSPRGEAG